MKILIAGGGIGGMAAALSCLHFGHDVTVLEQASHISQVGAGLQIPPNAMKIFAALGIADALAANAFAPRGIETRMGEQVAGKHGRTVFTIPLAEHALQRWGAPYLHVHRADYIAALQSALQNRAPDALRLNSKISRYEQTEKSITAHLENGQTVQADCLIGADGIHSAVRTQMLGADRPRFTGNVAWRAVVPVDRLVDQQGRPLAPNPTACAWVGKGRHGVTYLLRRGQLANFVGVVERDDWQTESWHAQGSKQQALADFSDWHPVITNLIERADDDALFQTALYDRPALPRWCDGRAALLGDAAHPMLPFLAQGAAMAVEDGWALAQQLSNPANSVPASLRLYQQRRIGRTTKVQAASRANAKTFHRKNALSQLGTYGPMWLAGKAMPSFVHSRMDWLYGHDETRTA